MLLPGITKSSSSYIYFAIQLNLNLGIRLRLNPDWDEQEHVSGAVDVLVVDGKLVGRVADETPVGDAADEPEAEGDLLSQEQQPLVPAETAVEDHKELGAP